MRTNTPAVAVVVTLAMLTFQAQIAHPQAVTVATVLNSAADALGMLRSASEQDALIMVEFWGTGTMNAVGAKMPGPAYKLTNYYGAVAYDIPGMRVDLTRIGVAGGAPERQIHVVSGAFAWDEVGQRGGGLVPGYGSATPAKAALSDRLRQLWTTPYGVVKAAVRAGDAAKLTVEGGARVITFPLTGPAVGPLAGVPVKLTLSSKNQPERVEVRMKHAVLGDAVFETTYSNYGDLNGAEYLADVMFPARIVQRLNNHPVLDLTVTKTNTYNPYIVIPVPPNVEKAGAQ